MSKNFQWRTEKGKKLTRNIFYASIRPSLDALIDKNLTAAILAGREQFATTLHGTLFQFVSNNKR